MSGFNPCKALSLCLTACVAMLVVAACAIPLRGDDDQARSPASLVQQSDPIATKLEQCRTVNYDQKDDLLQCQQLWAEKRRRFLGEMRGSSLRPEGRIPSTGSLSPGPRKDESRLPSGYPAIPAQSE
jgi:conjugative transfer region protein TrbK